MQKSKKKLNANTVGVDAYIDPLNQKGITLIALIITIIVMMILVGVTVATAINGGLFDTADDATTKTEKHSIYDQIVGAMKLADNGKINVAETYEAVEGNFSGKISETEWNEDKTEVTFKITGNRGTYEYKITGETIEENGEGAPKPPQESLSFYGTYSAYDAGENLMLELKEPDSEGNSVATMMGGNGSYTYDANSKTGSILFEDMDMEFTFEQKDILDENSGVINICLLATLGETGNQIIFSRYGRLGATPLTGKSYVDDLDCVGEFDIINVGNTEYGVWRDHKGSEHAYYVINGKLYFYGKEFLIYDISSDYKTITNEDGDVWTLIEE